MKQSVVRASLAGVLAAMLVATPQAYAKGKPSPPPPPPETPNNNAEWALIGLTTNIRSSNNGIRVDTGTPVVVGLFDGLTDCRHTDLTGHCENNLIPGGQYRFYDNHGTHTAGIIAGKTTGVAPAVKIVNYAVFDDRFYVATGSKLINAWTGAYGKGARIASMSFGCTGLALCFTGDEVKAMGASLASGGKPMLYIKAAGNDTLELKSESVAVTQGEALAALNRLILVGSVDVPATAGDPISMSYYSNLAGNGCLLYSGDTSCDADMKWQNYFIVAPGSSIYSTLPGNGYGMMSGTSMATPMVAGAAALLQARWPNLSPETYADILLDNTDDLGASGTDAVFGRGLLNVTKAFAANGIVKLQSIGGGSTEVINSTATFSPTMSGLTAALGSITVYDRYGRDFTLAETGRLQLRRTYDTVHQLLGRRLLGLGSQSDWTAALFETRHVTRGFASFGSVGEPVASTFMPDKTMRMGMDMPFKGGVAQLRMTGSSSARLDFAYDPSLRPLSFFASTGLLKSSMFGQALFNLGENSRLAVYGTTNSPGSINGNAPGEPLLLRKLGENSSARVALTGIPTDQRQQGFGIGYWTRPDSHTVIGFNASYLIQKGGYYDMASNVAGLDGTSRLLNLGAVVSRAMGSWELSAAGEVTHIRTSGASSALFQLTPSNIASAELRLRKAGVAFGGGKLDDSLSLALVVPPRAVSGSIRLDYMGPTADRMGLRPYNVSYALAGMGADPVKVEAGYQLTSGSGWTFELSGGANLKQTAYSGRGEALANLHLVF